MAFTVRGVTGVGRSRQWRTVAAARRRRAHATTVVTLALALAVTLVAGAPAGALATTGAARAVAASTPRDVWASPSGGAGNALTNLGESAITQATASGLTRAWGRDVAFAGVQGPAVVDGVVYGTRAPAATDRRWHFTALDVRTGALLWQVALPGGFYGLGASVSGDLALLPSGGWTDSDLEPQPGGLVAVSLSTRQVAWHHDLGRDADGAPYTVVGPVAIDGGRAYMLGGAGVTAYRLTTGRPLWTQEVELYVDRLSGYAAAGGRLFVGGIAGQGLTALDGATGARLWQGADGVTLPVAADGKVFVARTGAVLAYDQAGCGTPRCAPVWTTPLPRDSSVYGASVGAVGAGTLHVAYDDSPSGPPHSRLVRLSEQTGRVQWSTGLDGYAFMSARAGDLTWVTVGGESATTLRGYAASGSPSRPVVSVREPGRGTFPQGVAVADGSLVLSQWGVGLVAYRVPVS